MSCVLLIADICHQRLFGNNLISFDLGLNTKKNNKSPCNIHAVYLCRIDSSTITVWTGSFAVEGVSG